MRFREQETYRLLRDRLGLGLGNALSGLLLGLGVHGESLVRLMELMGEVGCVFEGWSWYDEDSGFAEMKYGAERDEGRREKTHAGFDSQLR
jgi:hypothetical protein